MYGLNKIYFVICYVFLPNFNIKFQKQKKFIEELCLNFRIRKSSRDRSQILHLMTSSQLQRQEDKKASVLIWISIIFIICQSVKLAPDLYEALFCTHKGVRLECLFCHFYGLNQNDRLAWTSKTDNTLLDYSFHYQNPT